MFLSLLPWSVKLFLLVVTLLTPAIAWNIACGFAQNKNQLIVFRLLAGLGGSAPLAVSRNIPSVNFGVNIF